MNNIITANNLVKSYKNGDVVTDVIKGINLYIIESKINLIMGKSGSGKTTLLNLLSGLEIPDNGQIIYKNNDICKFSESKLSSLRGKKFGFVFQDFNLIDEINISDNITLPLYVNNLDKDSSYLEFVIDMLDIKNILKKYPQEISGGEKQRVAIARAVIVKPDILFCDEPTGNLDEENSSNIIKLLEYINKEFNTTIVIVTHDKNLILNPHLTLHISDGKLI